ncbi:sucrose phosphorylase [Undibacterium sp.]|uniref:sucrose phosphorylase n=1 Tax=Undibacterium sp. TaxID=1914977 RepID=UPI00375218A9
MKNQVQLITYADRMSGKTLALLDKCLTEKLIAVFNGGVHILPFYESIHGADAGFDPLDHTQVDHTLGQWSDVQKITAHTPVMADVIVNHMSRHSPQFVDYFENGQASKYADLFLTREHIYPDGITQEQQNQIYRPRPTSPFTPHKLKDGTTQHFWTTFTSDQIDINVATETGQAYLKSIFKSLQNAGVRYARLDAIGYAVKRASTSCFMLPETFSFIDDISRIAKLHHIEVLVEIHSHYETQIEIASKVDRVYDFALPPLLLHSLFTSDLKSLKHWLSIRPTNCVTVLDTHDGIGIIDIGSDKQSGRPGLVSPQQLDELIERIHSNSNGQSRLATGHAASNVDLYQVNCTYFDALGRDEWAYLVARAIQFFLPGVPQVYYVGLLAGTNDMALLEKTKVGRDINRRYYTPENFSAEIKRPVVQDLIALIKFRNQHPAFAGVFKCHTTSDTCLHLEWAYQAQSVQLKLDLSKRSILILATDDRGQLSDTTSQFLTCLLERTLR